MESSTISINSENDTKKALYKKEFSFALKNEFESQNNEFKRQSIKYLEWLEPKHPIFSTELPSKIVKIVYESTKEIFKVVFDISAVLENHFVSSKPDNVPKPSTVKLCKNLQFVDEKLIDNSFTIWFTIQGLLKIATKQSMQSIANYFFDHINKFLLLDFELKQNFANFSSFSLKVETKHHLDPLPKSIEETIPLLSTTILSSGTKDVATNPEESNTPNMTKRVSLGNSSQLFSQLLERSSTEQLKNFLYMFTKDNAELLQALEQKYGQDFME